VVFSSGAIEVALGKPLIQYGFNTPVQINTSDIRWSALPKLWQWYLTLGAVIASTSHSQDMYDQAGDHVRGRRTVPLVVGDWMARLSLAIGVIFWSLLCPYFWESGIHGYAIVGLMGTIVSLRVLFCRSVPQDKINFLIWNGWVMCVYTLPFLNFMSGE
jgi:4-hydroxybenzoate polyprenyltransferase